MRMFLQYQNRSRLTAMGVSSAEDTIGPQTVLYMRMHVYEVTTHCVESTVNNLKDHQSA